MPRLQLRLYVNPGGADVFMNIRLKDGNFQPMAAYVDTGAEVSLLPIEFMEKCAYRLVNDKPVTIDQAGIARQVFTATEATIKLFLEDYTGTRTGEFEARVWFADTDEVLLGFADILDHATLHIDMPQRAGWIEMNA